jgi:hypothetical protein
MTWVADGIYAAGGEHIPSTWAAFSQQTGIRAVLHLSLQQPQYFRGPTPTRFLWLDIGDESGADLSSRQLVGEYVIACREAGQAVLLHSAQGRHRVRWAFVAHQLCTGRKLTTVLREAAEKPWLAPYHTDQAIWQAFYDGLKASTSEPPVPQG